MAEQLSLNDLVIVDAYIEKVVNLVLYTEGLGWPLLSTNLSSTCVKCLHY